MVLISLSAKLIEMRTSNEHTLIVKRIQDQKVEPPIKHIMMGGIMLAKGYNQTIIAFDKWKLDMADALQATSLYNKHTGCNEGFIMNPSEIELFLCNYYNA
jgi:hypothetical protein